MKVAFTSCMDPIDSPKQKVWKYIREHRPDLLILLGDNVYLDYGGTSDNWDNEEPQRLSDDEFARALYTRYQAQASIDNFRDAVNEIPRVEIIWDDHDFIGNNSNGYDYRNPTTNDANNNPPRKHLISKALFYQYSEWLNTRPLPVAYPAMPSMQAMLGQADQGIQRHFDIDQTRFIMTDVRFYRQGRDEEAARPDNPAGAILGEEQQQWVRAKIEEWSGVKVICAGTALNSSSGWVTYPDYAWLKSLDLANCVFATGDIHKAVIQYHDDLGVMEIVASGAARPLAGKRFLFFKGGSKYYAILDIEGEAVHATAYKERKILTRGSPNGPITRNKK